MLGTYIETLQALYTRTTFFLRIRYMQIYYVHVSAICIYKNIFLTRNDRIQR